MTAFQQWCMAFKPQTTLWPCSQSKNPAKEFPQGGKANATLLGWKTAQVCWLKGMTSDRLKLEVNRVLRHGFMAILEPRLVPAHSFLFLHSAGKPLVFCEEQICQIKCLYVVSHCQKPLSYTSGCKQSERGRKSEDPELELSCPANQDILPGEFCFSAKEKKKT